MKWIVPVAVVGLCLMGVTSAAAEDLSTSLANADKKSPQLKLKFRQSNSSWKRRVRI
jgi:hypothetical protein